LQNDNQSTEIFTDIDQYNDYQGTNDNNQGIDGKYGGWGSNYTQTDITVYPSNFNAGWGLGFNGWGNPYFNNGLVGISLTGGFGWNNAFMVMDLDGAIHSDLDMEDLDTGIWWTCMEASDGIINTTATITLVI
jgi:hypothetical protein